MSENQEKKKLLIIENDLDLQKQLRRNFDNYEVLVASDRMSALTKAGKYKPAVVTMELGLPPDTNGGSEGFATLQQIKALTPDTKIIFLTANQNHANTLKAIGMGAHDFFHKPFDPEMLKVVVDRAFYLHGLQQENRCLNAAQSSSPIDGLITRDPELLNVCQSIEKVAPSNATIMLLGESGTGKEVLARALHNLSNRKNNRFMAINCAAIPESLLESELFGYEKGAFTGASKQSLGKIELADGGTFFLDEVGDLPYPLQGKLQRFLQERVIERIGGRKEIPVDVRITCATHQNLSKLMETKHFREDLYYRLSEIVFTIPPLRNRIGDAVLLAHHFKNKFCARKRITTLNFSQEALAAIEKHQWIGNVREIRNCIKRAVIMAEDSTITARDLGLTIGDISTESLNLKEIREREEYKALVKAMARVNGNVAQAAKLLGVS